MGFLLTPSPHGMQSEPLRHRLLLFPSGISHAAKALHQTTAQCYQAHRYPKTRAPPSNTHPPQVLLSCIQSPIGSLERLAVLSTTTAQQNLLQCTQTLIYPVTPSQLPSLLPNRAPLQLGWRAHRQGAKPLPVTAPSALPHQVTRLSL